MLQNMGIFLLLLKYSKFLKFSTSNNLKICFDICHMIVSVAENLKRTFCEVKWIIKIYFCDRKYI